jgi:hypothetical protein
MISMTLKGHVDSEGRLLLTRLTLPELRDSEVDIIIVKRTETQMSEVEPVDANGWPLNFFDRLDAIIADDLQERPVQLPLEERDLIE